MQTPRKSSGHWPAKSAPHCSSPAHSKKGKKMARVPLRMVLCCAALALLAAGAAAAEPTPPEIVSLLKKGGHVLFFRHASTDMSQDDRAMKSYEDCSGQRNLIERGREEARAIGRS